MALMPEAFDAREGHAVLEVGTGTGCATGSATATSPPSRPARHRRPWPGTRLDAADVTRWCQHRLGRANGDRLL
jgi:hypothetical protein